MKSYTSAYRKNDILSFEVLIDYLKDKVQKTSNPASRILIEHVLKEVDKTPDLRGDIYDYSVLEKHCDVVQQLMSSILSPIDFENEIMAVIKPFDLQSIVFSTKKWRDLIDVEKFNFSFKDLDFETFQHNTIAYTNSFILNKVYGLQELLHKNLLITVPSKENGLNKYYKAYFNKDYLRVTYKKTPPKLSQEVLEQLSENPSDVALWQEHLNIDDFDIKGFVVIKLMDVTQNEVLSSLKYDLLEKDAIISREKFSNLEVKLRELYDIPVLRLGIVSFAGDKEGKTAGPKIWNSIISEEEMHYFIADKGITKEEAFEGCVYHRMMETGVPQTISNLEKLDKPSMVEQLLLNKGIKSIVVSPLHYNGECLGGIEIGSPNANDFNNSSNLLMQDILPIFSLAAKRSLEELESNLQAVIKEKFTAVHPSVEWKFVQAALSEMNREDNTDEAVPSEEIVFNDVYPIYGQSDVRGSSTERNKAIQEDLTEQLGLAKEVLKMVYENYPMGIIEEISSRIDESLAGIKEGIGSGDEMSILYFLKNELEPLLKHFSEAGILSAEPYAYYFNQLDSELGILYKRRKAFEDSLTKINDKVAHFLEEKQDSIQKIYPHYFEKYKTDGVEYNIYVGQSITPNKPFNKVYLNDLRLWQLKTTAEIAQITDALKYKLPLALETTHLILVNSAPIAIRFREDEKQFDVDGAYNIRYEIIKKRIDKAHIKGSDERITQPGKIAIVYTQDIEAEEYKRYIRYLQKQGLITEDIEDYELEELQGVNGLRALRVQVNMGNLYKDDFTEKVIEKVLQTEDT